MSDLGRGGEVAGVGGVKARGGEKPDEPRGVLTPEVGHNPPVSGCFTRDLGFFRDGAGEFTGPTWGIYGTHLGNLRDPLGEFTRPTWGIYGPHLGNLRDPIVFYFWEADACEKRLAWPKYCS